MRIARLLLILLVSGLAVGCSSTRNVPINSPSSIESSRVNTATRGKLTKVHLRDGRRMYGIGVHVRTDTTSWVEPNGSNYYAVGTDEVNRITIVRAGQGALVGLASGVVLGVGTGILRAKNEGDDPPDQHPSVSEERKMFVYSLAHSAYASLLTVPLGAVIGRKNHYRIVRE